MKAKRRYSRLDPKQIKLEEDHMDFIAIDGAPLYGTSRPGLINLIKNRDPLLHIPSGKTMAGKLKARCKKVIVV